MELTRDGFADFNVVPSLAADERQLAIGHPTFFAETAWQYADETRRAYSEAYLEELRGPALRNFDLNMSFFARVDSVRFGDALSALCANYPSLEPTDDIEALAGVSGVYVMVLDRYKQVYIGRSGDMRSRIRRHWTSMTPLDRVIFGDETTSSLPIGVFRALDTTRVFISRNAQHASLEQEMVADFPADYRLNRAPGGDLGDLWAMHTIAARQDRRLCEPSSP